MPITSAQCRAGRALIGWSQDQLADASGISKATIANYETGKRAPYISTLYDLKGALETAGVEFGDTLRSGVMLKEGYEGAPTPLRQGLDPLHVAASTREYVRLRSGDGTVSIIIDVGADAIDDYFRMRFNTFVRRVIVESNLFELMQIVEARYRFHKYGIETDKGKRPLHFHIGEEDLSKAKLSGLPQGQKPYADVQKESYGRVTDLMALARREAAKK